MGFETVDELIEALEEFRGQGKPLMAIESEGLNYSIRDITLEEGYDGKVYVSLNEEERT